MKYDQILGLVPTGEHCDMSAMNEGIFLSVGHVTAIENALAANASIKTQFDSEALRAQQAETSLATANTARETAEASLVTANQTITTQKTKITELEARVAELEEEAPVTATVKEKDKGGKDKVAFHESADSSFNKIADGLLGKPAPKAELK